MASIDDRGPQIPASVADQSADTAGPRPHAPKILVVDENPDGQLLLRELLSSRGYEVMTAGEADEARDLVRSGHPDLILLDVVLPQNSGYELCRELKQDSVSRQVPMVMLKGICDREDHLRGMEAGADDLLRHPLYPEELFSRVKSLMKLKDFTGDLENAESVLRALALGIESRDIYTGSHCRGVARYAADVGHHIGLDQESVVALERGGYLHDLGKVSVPDEILRKSSELTPSEWEQMKQHPVTGEAICRPLKLFNNVLPIIRHHHEHWDGSGYPDQLRKSEIPLLARILGIVDAYDAMRTARTYKPAMAHADVERIMTEEAGRGLWDRDLVTIFFAMLERKDEV
jgi:putative two-component system response regulator